MATTRPASQDQLNPAAGSSETHLHVLLYDGVCGFCNWTVRWILKHDKKGTIRFAPLQSSFGKSVLAGDPALESVDSIVVVDRRLAGKPRLIIRSAAALHIAAYLGGPWKLLLIGYVVPNTIRDFFYDLFARHRYRLFGRYETCPLPTPDERERFVDE